MHYRRSVQRKASDGGHQDSDQEHEVSQPGEPAEQEADAVADHVTDELHAPDGAHGANGQAQKTVGPGKDAAAPAAAERPGAQPKPISAKLDASVGRKVQLERTPSTPTLSGSDRKISRVQAKPSGARIYRASNGPASDAQLHEKAGPGGLKEASVKSHDGKSDQALVNVGDKSMAKNPDFEKDAMTFEDKLGAKAWNHPAALAGASDMAHKAKAYIQDRVGGKWDAANTELQSLAQKMGSDNPGWSGAVGKAVKDVMAVFDEGNIAERMNHVGEFFIKILAKDLVETDAKDLEKRLTQAKMDAAGLMQRRDEMLKKKDARGGKENNWDIAPTAPGSAAADQWHARVDRADVAGVPRDDKKGRSKVAQSGRKLASTGADMSGREETLAKKDQPDWDKNKDAVKWEEGVKVWMINERDKWVQLQRSLSLPLGAGPSGTTNMLMQAATALKTDPINARTACIAYLLPAHHHTLVEILSAAAPFGCDYSPGQQMYRNIKPFSEADLRACGKDNKFPDETSGDDKAVASNSGKPGAPPSSADKGKG